MDSIGNVVLIAGFFQNILYQNDDSKVPHNAHHSPSDYHRDKVLTLMNDDSKVEIRLADFGSCTTDGHEVNEYIVTRPYRPPEVSSARSDSNSSEVQS
jgi:serine/threonine protein kinase